MSPKEKITEKINKLHPGESLFLPLCIFVLSRVHIYSDIMPFGFAALSGTGAAYNPLALLAFVTGTATGDPGLLAYLRHIAGAAVFMGLKNAFARQGERRVFALFLCPGRLSDRAFL